MSNLASNERLIAVCRLIRESAADMRNWPNFVSVPRQLIGEMREALYDAEHQKGVHETEALQLRAVPSAWMRGIKSYVPGEPDEWDTEFSYGDDQPEGEGWVPLYSKPPHLRPSQVETGAKPADGHTVFCDHCDASVVLPYTDASKSAVSIAPIEGWSVETRFGVMCPKCSSGKASVPLIKTILDRKVTVCAACLCAGCWQGDFYCDSYKTAGTVEKTLRELLQGNVREDSGYWFKDANTGKVDYETQAIAKRAWLAENGKGDGA